MSLFVLTRRSRESITLQGGSSAYSAAGHPAISIVFEPTSGTADDQSCTWGVGCSDGSPVTLTFSRLDIEESFDFVNIYSGATATGTPIAQLTGQLADNQATYTVPGDLAVEFSSDESVGGRGFGAQP